MLTEQDKEIIRRLQDGLPLVPRPYKLLAERLGMQEDALIARIKYFIENGQIRRFGATVRHLDLGFKANAMVVWDVPDEKVNDVGRAMAAFDEVTHCYRRPRRTGWPYNLFTMVHGRTRDECVKTAEKLSRATGMDQYRLLFSTAELKKSSMRYFE